MRPDRATLPYCHRAREAFLSAIHPGPEVFDAVVKIRKVYADANDKEGWTAFFVELTYPTGGKYPLKFTSGVRVLPDTLPFAAYTSKRR